MVRQALWKGLGVGVVAFVLAYVGIVAFSLPGATVATLTGGFLFGLFPGVFYNLAGATAGAVLLFLAARAGFGASRLSSNANSTPVNTTT